MAKRGTMVNCRRCRTLVLPGDSCTRCNLYAPLGKMPPGHVSERRTGAAIEAADAAKKAHESAAKVTPQKPMAARSEPIPDVTAPVPQVSATSAVVPTASQAVEPRTTPTTQPMAVRKPRQIQQMQQQLASGNPKEDEVTNEQRLDKLAQKRLDKIRSKEQVEKRLRALGIGASMEEKKALAVQQRAEKLKQKQVGHQKEQNKLGLQFVVTAGDALGAAQGLYDKYTQINREFRRVNMASVENARIMGGSVGQMRTLQKSFKAYDDYLGAQEGWSESLFKDFRDKLGLSSDNATALLHKIQQAALPENLGADATDSLAHHLIDVNKRMREQRQNMAAMGLNTKMVRMTARELANEFNDNVPLQKKVTEELQRQHKGWLDQEEINGVINRLLDETAKKKLPSPAEVMPAWKQFENFVATQLNSTIRSAEEEIAKFLDIAINGVNIAKNEFGVEKPKGPSVGGFFDYWTGGAASKSYGVNGVGGNTSSAIANQLVNVAQKATFAGGVQQDVNDVMNPQSSPLVMVPHASGGNVTDIRNGMAVVQPARGEGLASIGRGETIVPAGGGGGAVLNFTQHNNIQHNGQQTAPELGQSLASTGTQFLMQELAKAGFSIGAS